MRSSTAILAEAKMREASLHLVGYVRTSKDRDDHAEQLGAVRAAGCGRVFEDVSDGRADRPGLKAALDYLRPGDTLVVHSLSRLACSVRELLELGEELSRRRVELKNLRDSIDTRTQTAATRSKSFRRWPSWSKTS